MLSKSDYRYFKKAHQAALISDFEKTHVGCIAVYQGNIIAIGCNTHKTHPKQQYLIGSGRYAMGIVSIFLKCTPKYTVLM